MSQAHAANAAQGSAAHEEFLPRTLFGEEHRLFREKARRFCEREIAPHHAQWEKDHCVSREAWRKAGQAGLLCCWMPEQYGGGGTNFLFDVIFAEELGRIGATGPGFPLHSLIVAPYIEHHAPEDLKARVLPKMASGEWISAVAMTEPGAGSDLAGIRTSARRDGDHYVINGQKTFITNGGSADVIVVVAKTRPDAGAKGVSLFVVEATMPGFSRGRVLEKIGRHAQDTAELFFDGVRVPASHLIGGEDRGFACLMQELAQERLLISIHCQARAEAALRWTIDYTKGRKAFGRTLAEFQNTRFKLAGLKAEVQAGRAFCDRLIELHLARALDAPTASAGKLWHSEMVGRVVDECVQLHGGYGYMAEYPIGRAYMDARVERIYGGSSEIMKEIIARSL